MSLAVLESLPKPRLGALLEHLGRIDDPREPWRVAHPLVEVLFLVVCGTICGCDSYDEIAEWGEAHLPFLRRHRPYHHGVPGARWLTLLMNRIPPALFGAAFRDWVRACWPERPTLVAFDGKTLRRSHDRAQGRPPLHMVSAFATTTGLVLGQEAVPDKANELSAITSLLEQLGQGGGLRGALVTIDAIATNPAIARAIRAAGAHYLLAVKANQPSLQAEVEALFGSAGPGRLQTHRDVDKGHGRLEIRTVDVAGEVDWLDAGRRFPGEMRLPDVACLVRVVSHVETKGAARTETRYYISSAPMTAAQAADAVRRHWGIENQLHWVLDVTFAEDQARLRKGHGAHNMALVRHFAINLIRTAPEPVRPPRSPLKRGPRPGSVPRPTSLKLRRKMAAWNTDYLQATLTATAC
jgi:predicted transposase YbfD/YdcC